MTLTRLHLIRHGVTASNTKGVYMGRSEESLSPEGRWQAREVARRLQDLDFEAIYSSPLRRARETAEIVAQPHGRDIRLDPDIVELDLTRWQGRPAEKIAASDPEEWRIWCSDPARLVVAGIETFDDLASRVRRFLGRVRQAHSHDSVAVCTHDGVIRMALLESLGISWGHYRSLPLDNTSVSVVEVGGPHPRLRSFNDVSHLWGPGVSGPADGGMTYHGMER